MHTYLGLHEILSQTGQQIKHSEPSEAVFSYGHVNGCLIRVMQVL